jgi:hypothetical protein
VREGQVESANTASVLALACSCVLQACCSLITLSSARTTANLLPDSTFFIVMSDETAQADLGLPCSRYADRPASATAGWHCGSLYIDACHCRTKEQFICHLMHVLTCIVDAKVSLLHTSRRQEGAVPRPVAQLSAAIQVLLAHDGPEYARCTAGVGILPSCSVPSAWN